MYYFYEITKIVKLYNLKLSTQPVIALQIRQITIQLQICIN